MSPLASAAIRRKAPGVEFIHAATQPGLPNISLDECGFAGVATRGPANVPWMEPGQEPIDVAEWLAAPRRRSVAVAVENWEDYVRTFGGFEGPGLLPYAVASFFAQGGRRAHVVRVVSTPPFSSLDRNDVACGTFISPGLQTILGDVVELRAKNPGAWGNRLRAELTATTSPLTVDPKKTTVSELWLQNANRLEVGSVVRIRIDDGAQKTWVQRRIAAVRLMPQPPSKVLRVPVAILSTPLPSLPPPDELRVEQIRFDLTVSELDDDGRVMSSPVDRTERHLDIGLDPMHPRWLAWVLGMESQLVEPVADWAEVPLLFNDALDDAVTVPFGLGRDCYADIVFDDVVTAQFVDEPPYPGVHALAEIAQLGMFSVPDLFSPIVSPPASVDPIASTATDIFEPCVTVVQPRLNVADVGLPGLELDPRDPPQLEQLIDLQDRLVSFADRMQCPTVLLDVPPGLSPSRLRGWRARFATAFAAAYHPWVVVSRQGDTVRNLINIPPSAVAAGIIASRELYGRVAAGPANVLARDVLDVTTRVSGALHDDLHSRGINVFVAERDGIRLTGARTLSPDPQWRQLSVRRLVSTMELALRVGMTWAAFEPNGPTLWSAVRHAIGTYLQSIWMSGGLAGASADESYFVRCDRSTMTTNDLDSGRMIAQVGIAPAEPLEFIVVELRCQDTGVTTGIGHV
jgi:uncharacterized protein